jgi:hypothetical protein
MVFVRLQPPFQWVLVFFSPGVKLLGTEVTPSPHIVPRLRMSGARPLLPLYAFMEWTGKALPFSFYLVDFNKQPRKFPSRVKSVLDVGDHFHPKAVFGRQIFGLSVR